jgi:hypothetical protein
MITNIVPAVFPTPAYFEIGSVNAILPVAVTTPTEANMVIAKNRIALPIRFTCLQPKATNGVVQVHF